MNISINHNECYNYDEMARKQAESAHMKSVLEKDKIRQYHIKRMHEVEWCKGKDYERPLAKDTTVRMKRLKWWRYYKFLIP